MRTLEGSLAAYGGSEVVFTGENGVSATDILKRAAAMERVAAPIEGRRVLSLDASPATLLALLVVAERHPCSLVLGRPSTDRDSIEMVQPDVVIQEQQRVESRERTGRQPGEWTPGIFILTSGTTGTPKLVHQTLAGLLGRVRNSSLEKNRGGRWLLTYESHSFAGLQVILSAILSGGLLIAPEVRDPAALAQAARSRAATHISGTPTFWRALLIAAKDDALASLSQITLGGEAVDQPTLDRLARAFPGARISHIYASSEAGALFAVHDRRAGFPAAWLKQELPGGVGLRIREDVLEVKSPRRMVGYASGQQTPLTEDGWLVSGDLVRIDGDRVYFAGRKDQVVNVAGLKVSPAEVEAVLLEQPMVADAQVYAIASPLTGALLAARVVLRPGFDPKTSLEELRATCAASLPRHKMPRRFDIADSIVMSASGKKALPV